MWVYYFVKHLPQNLTEPSEDDSPSEFTIPRHEIWLAAGLKFDATYINDDAANIATKIVSACMYKIIIIYLLFKKIFLCQLSIIS